MPWRLSSKPGKVCGDQGHSALPGSLRHLSAALQTRSRRPDGRSHPNILKIFDFSEFNNQYILVMEYIRRGHLRTC
jgi:hypothetical protein